MPITIRIPDDLGRDCRERCARLGISFNALVAVALDEYLRGPRVAEAAAVATVAAGAAAVPDAGPVCPPGLSKAQRRKWRIAHGLPAHG